MATVPFTDVQGKCTVVNGEDLTESELRRVRDLTTGQESDRFYFQKVR